MKSTLQFEKGNKRRYPGLRSFEDDVIDRQLFYGRDREQYDLLYLVLAERLAVLFSKSGMGKSSIINVGLMQPLRDRDFFPMVVRVNSANDNPIDSFYKSIQSACDRGIKNHQIDEYEPSDPADWNRTSLWHFIKTLYIWREDQLLTPVIIIDQFEELFTLISHEKRLEFVDELADLIRGKHSRRLPKTQKSEADELGIRPPDVKVVLSIREDFLANLEEMAERIPSILKSRFRLGPLHPEQAKLALINPAKQKNMEFVTQPFEWSPEAIQCILNFLCKRKSIHGGTIIGNEVEPFQLQLVCQFVEDLAQRKALTIISEKELGGEKALQRILDRFYQSSIKKLSKKFRGLRLRRWLKEAWEYRLMPPKRRLKRRLRDLCEYGLITPKGRRLLQEESVIRKVYRIPPDMLSEMVHLRLLRKEPRVGDNYYELSHDTLITPILASRKKRKLLKWVRWIGLIVLPLLFIVFCVMVYTYYSNRASKLHDHLLSNKSWTNELLMAGDTLTQTQYQDKLTSSALDDVLPNFKGLHLDKWNYQVSEPQFITITLSSAAFDTFLLVRTPSCDILSNDDYLFDSTRSTVHFESAPGVTHILISSFSGIGEGDYTLTIESENVDEGSKDLESNESLNSLVDCQTPS